MSKQQLVLLGNYSPDQQWSMRLYADLLREAATTKAWEIQTWKPPRVLGRWGNPHRGFGKLCAYLDKYLIAPRALTRIVQSHPQAVFHLVDHSNAPYLQVLPPERTLLTCHDAIALRRAHNEFAQNPPSRLFRQQQAYIMRGMKRAQHVFYVSQLTKRDYEKLFGENHWRKATVVHQPIPQTLPTPTLKALPNGLQTAPFLLHHSSNSFYKNRPFVSKIFREIAATHPNLNLVFSGSPLPSAMLEAFEEDGLRRRVYDLGCVERTTLAALYQKAAAVLFPSLIEGYGWPPLEAASKGAVLLASPTGVLPELLQPPAIRYAQPNDLSGWLQHLEAVLTSPEEAATMRTAIRAAPLPSRAAFAEEMHAQWAALLPEEVSFKD